MASETRPSDMSATAAAAAIRDGKLTSVALVEDCLARINEREAEVEAWTFLDQDHALRQAEEADRRHRAGRDGPLNGVPVGLKDNFDTFDMPTENGTVLHAGRRPNADAASVALLRAAGAVIMGKTVTTEMAFYTPGKTRNPLDTRRTPGGSSSGSAAAVAAKMVPLATGSQTNGSVIRPGAFCGIVSYKPTHGLIPVKGVLTSSEPLDTVGIFARDVMDAALMAEQMMVHDWSDPHARPRAQTRLVDVARQAPPATPRLAFVKTAVWKEAEPATQEAFVALAKKLAIDEVGVPEIFEQAIAWHTLINEADLARNYRREYEQGRDRLSQRLREMIESGQKVSAVDYIVTREKVRGLNRALDDIFAKYDAILTPAAIGSAPMGITATGTPIFCSLWTLCNTPAICLPLLKAPDGMPLGVQLVGPHNDDARLLRTARWLTDRLSAAG